MSTILSSLTRPRIHRSEIQALPDILSTDNFIVLFPNIPYVATDTYTSITLEILNVPLISSSSQFFTATPGGYTVTFRGRQEYPGGHVMEMAFVQPDDMRTIRALMNWMEVVAGSESGTSEGYKKDYSTDATVYLFDTAGNAVDAIVYKNTYIVQAPRFELSVSRSTALLASARFAFDYIERYTIARR